MERATTTAERFTWNQEQGNEPTIQQLAAMLQDVFTVMRSQRTDSGEWIADANQDLYTEVREMLGFVDACHFASGAVTFNNGGAQ
jgi:hypothetical protein